MHFFGFPQPTLLPSPKGKRKTPVTVSGAGAKRFSMQCRPQSGSITRAEATMRMSNPVLPEFQSSAVGLGKFADAARSWDRMISNAEASKCVKVFCNCCTEGANFVSRGANRAAVAGELTDLAQRHNLEEALGGDDGIQQIISDAFRTADKISQAVIEIAERSQRAPCPEAKPGLMLSAWPMSLRFRLNGFGQTGSLSERCASLRGMAGLVNPQSCAIGRLG